MTVISIQDLVRDPDGLIGRLKNGESLILTKDGAPVGEIRPTPPRDMTPRPHGLAKGQFVVPDDFDAPLPEDILRDFEGS